MNTRRHGSRRRGAKRSISTVFALIADIVADRQTELAQRPQVDNSSGPPVGIHPNGAALLEDLAIEQRGRGLELVELANRIAILGYEQFGQRLDLIATSNERRPTPGRNTGGGRMSPLARSHATSTEAPNPARITRALQAHGLFDLAREIAAKHHVTTTEVFSRSRAKPESLARRELWARAYELIPSFMALGRLFDRSHTVVRAGILMYLGKTSATRTAARGLAPAEDGASGCPAAEPTIALSAYPRFAESCADCTNETEGTCN